MQRAQIPTKFNIPFANSAGGSFIRVVPEASQIGIQDGAASLTTGFPPLNFLPTGAGGVPPFGADFNGLLFQSTSWDRWFSAGGPVPYDSAFSASVGGYPQGAVVASATILGLLWFSLVDDNTADPDVVGAGAAWRAQRFGISVNGQCYLSWVNTTQVKLVPRGGAAIVIAGIPYVIPAAGIIANVGSTFVSGTGGQALAPSTVYNVYLFNNAGTLTLAFWTGASGTHVADTTPGNVGVEVRNPSGTPDPTHTLVGKVVTNAGTLLVTGQGYSVISWFNKEDVALAAPISTDSLNSQVARALAVAGQLSFLTWAEGATFKATISFTTNLDNSGALFNMTADSGSGAGTEYIDVPNVTPPNSNAGRSGMVAIDRQFAEGVHNAIPGGRCLDGGTTIAVTAFQVTGIVRG